MPVMKSRSISSATLSMFFARLFKLAGRIIALMEPFNYKLLPSATERIEKDKIIDSVMQSAADEELFTMDETLNMMYQRRKT
jgi:hypothetical protein